MTERIVVQGQLSPCCADLRNRQLLPREVGPDGGYVRGPEWEIWICFGTDPATGKTCGRRHVVLNAEPAHFVIGGAQSARIMP